MQVALLSLVNGLACVLKDLGLVTALGGEGKVREMMASVPVDEESEVGGGDAA